MFNQLSHSGAPTFRTLIHLGLFYLSTLHWFIILPPSCIKVLTMHWSLSLSGGFDTGYFCIPAPALHYPSSLYNFTTLVRSCYLVRQTFVVLVVFQYSLASFYPLISVLLLSPTVTFYKKFCCHLDLHCMRFTD